MKCWIFALCCLMLTQAVGAQSDNRMDFETYDPASTLVVEEHILSQARFPFIDVHNHQSGMSSGSLAGLAADMQKMNMAVMVNLSGGSGDNLREAVNNARKNYPGKFLVFANIDFSGIGNNGWADNAVKQLTADVANGASGLKIFKNLGFSVNDIRGKRVPVDDPRLDPVWKACAQLRIPVLIHTADPKSFWDPVDETNERWLELNIHPRRKRGDKDPAPFETLLAEQHRMFKKHPQTTFINAHFGWLGNDLKRLGKLLEELPNVVIEFGAVIAELGRQPRAAAAFFNKYQDRILFGKDAWVPAEYTTYFRVLETADEFFPYHKKYHAWWRIYGLHLPDSILKKVYYKNALRILPGIDKTFFPE